MRTPRRQNMMGPKNQGSGDKAKDFKSAIKRFYLRPFYILKMLSKIRSLQEVKNYFTAGLNDLLRK